MEASSMHHVLRLNMSSQQRWTKLDEWLDGDLAP
jgi:hypothetical protein